MKDAMGAHVDDKSIIVFGNSENFKSIWGQDPDWDLALEPIQ